MISIVRGDLLAQTHCEAIVNAWNRNFPWWFLLVPQGVSGAIHKRAGLRPFVDLGLGLMAPGEARMTGAGKLPFKAVIHVAGIDWHRFATTITVREGAKNAVLAARSAGSSSLAMPVLGSGTGGMRPEKALELMRQGIASANSDGNLAITIVQYAR